MEKRRKNILRDKKKVVFLQPQNKKELFDKAEKADVTQLVE